MALLDSQVKNATHKGDRSRMSLMRWKVGVFVETCVFVDAFRVALAVRFWRLCNRALVGVCYSHLTVAPCSRNRRKCRCALHELFLGFWLHLSKRGGSCCRSKMESGCATLRRQPEFLLYPRIPRLLRARHASCRAARYFQPLPGRARRFQRLRRRAIVVPSVGRWPCKNKAEPMLFMLLFLFGCRFWRAGVG